MTATASNRWSCALVLALATCAACSFDSPGPSRPDPCTEASVSCASDTVLRTCGAGDATAVTTECPWGCLETGTPHCGALVPAGGAITSADFTLPELADVMLADTTINTDTGEIKGVRASGVGVKTGIDYYQSPRAAVLRVKSLRITGTVLLKGKRALAIIASGAISIEGTLDGRGDLICGATGKVAGPGGFDGGAEKMAAMGMGGGAGTAVSSSGGGGGGHGGTGGTGGGATGAAGGPAFGEPEILTLVGGGGGGGGGSGPNSGTGGGGGAALQLASGTSIAIAAAGGINAGGCGGDLGQGGNDGGGGGGAGGTILLEAPSITIAGKLAVNGGGGGSRSVVGANATLDRTAAAGGESLVAGNGKGGDGGAGNTLAGGTGVNGTNGGGGGAVGRMRFHTRTGAVTVEGGAILSPALDDAPTTTTQALARVQ